VAGTSGYDFLVRANDLFVDPAGEPGLTECYQRFTGDPTPYADVVLAAKRQVMAAELSAEVQRLTRALAALCDGERRQRDHTHRELREALEEVVASFPVYRTYVTADAPAHPIDRAHIASAVADAARRRPDLDAELLAHIGTLAAGGRSDAASIDFAARFQQFTAPVMAKGVEDTAFYRYHRLISLNEVGGDPDTFGRSVDAFHAATAEVAARWPRSMLTLSTHDTKRSADVRARLNVLSEEPRAWSRAVERWAERNDRHRIDGTPDRNAEYLLYQTIVGAWPLDADRAVAFMAKATKEAKVHTSWVDPDVGYDAAVEAFTRSVLGDDGFVADVEAFLAATDIVTRGRRNALAQTALLLTAPGVPDIYQGTELWDLSLVDPDNRRPVDYPLRARLLDSLRTAVDLPELSDDGAGVRKLQLVHRLLEHRRSQAEHYEAATYEPLAVRGAAEGVAAFSRGHVATVAACRTSTPSHPGATVRLPSGRWTDLVTGAGHDGGEIGVDAMLGTSPVAVLARGGA
jgi:(1->4)-alpha-D-glucan 1-alpha-D-glucosylmutase